MMHIPGVQYAKDEVNVQEYYIIKRYGEEVPAMLIIDGLEVSFGEFVSFPISAVESIEVIKRRSRTGHTGQTSCQRSHHVSQQNGQPDGNGE